LSLQEAAACSGISFTNIKLIGMLSAISPSPVCFMYEYQLEANGDYFPVEKRNTDDSYTGREKFEIF
jgi:hypothetical protein